MTEAVVRNLILKALKEVGVEKIDRSMPWRSKEEALEISARTWLRYALENGLSEEELYKKLLEAFEFMKDFYFRAKYGRKSAYFLDNFTPYGYRVAKEAKELGIDEVIQRLLSVKEYLEFYRKKIELWNEALKRGEDKELIITYETLKGGEKYIPIYTFFVSATIRGRNSIRLSKETIKVVEEVAKEEGVSDELLMKEVEFSFEGEIESWIWELDKVLGKRNYLERRIGDNELMLLEETDEGRKKELEKKVEEAEKEKGELEEKLRKMLEEAKEGLLKKAIIELFRYPYDPDTDGFSDSAMYIGLVYTEKENWEKVREWLKERVRQIAREEIEEIKESKKSKKRVRR